MFNECSGLGTCCSNRIKILLEIKPVRSRASPSLLSHIVCKARGWGAGRVFYFGASGKPIFVALPHFMRPGFREGVRRFAVLEQKVNTGLAGRKVTNSVKISDSRGEREDQSRGRA